MESGGVVLGMFSASIFNLEKGRYLSAEVLHLMPENAHANAISTHNYYSPEKLKMISCSATPAEPIDPFKSEVFSFGLLILEVATCPASKPKFHKPAMTDILWSQVKSRVQNIRVRYSEKLLEFVGMTLREDVRVRPDWSYLKTWVSKNENCIDVAPCVFWAI
jgi:hypothetical protein